MVKIESTTGTIMEFAMSTITKASLVVEL